MHRKQSPKNPTAAQKKKKKKLRSQDDVEGTSVLEYEPLCYEFKPTNFGVSEHL
jgi:hypothetical protein